MRINPTTITYTNFGKNNTKKKENRPKIISNVTEVCSKNASRCLAAINLLNPEKIPETGSIPKSIMKKCQTGEKGKIIDKKTGKEVRVTAEIVANDKSDGKTLNIKSGRKIIGYAYYKKADSNHGFLMGAEEYIKNGSAIYVDYMKNKYKSRYSHIGTLMHRILHEISKQSGCDGKMILQTMNLPAPFHYDSGFRPMISLNPSNKYWKTQAEITELKMAKGRFASSANMYLDEENMKKLEKGQHVIPKEIKNMDETQYWNKIKELQEIIRNSDPWD